MVYEAKNIGKSYDGKTVIDNFFLTVEEGDMIAVVSRKGGGMTTLIQILTGMIPADSGKISYYGKKVAEKGRRGALQKLRRNDIAYVTRDSALMSNMTIYDNFMLALAFQKGSAGTKKKICRDMIIDLGLKGKGRFLPRELSALERQKVVLGRALIKNPKVIFCDEPTDVLEGYDAEQYLAFLQLMNNNGEGPAFVVTTHSKRVAGRFPKIVALHKDIDVGQVTNASATIEGLSNTITGSSVVNAEKKKASRRDVEMEDVQAAARKSPDPSDVANIENPKVSEDLSDFEMPELDLNGLLDEFPQTEDFDYDDNITEENEEAASYDEKFDDGEEFLEDEAGDSSEKDDEDEDDI